MSAVTAVGWRDAYLEAASRLAAAAPAAATTFTGTSACVDAIFHIDADRLARLVRATAAAGCTAGDHLGAALLAEVLERVQAGRGGELVRHWPGGAAWFVELLGPADRFQVGGTGPQASWALAVLGAPSVVALRDRSRQQLAVLDPRIGVCEDGRIVPAGAARRTDDGAKQPHCILEFTAGTPFDGDVVGRSTRLILRFGDEPVEADDEYARLTPQLTGARAGLVSGLNGPADDDPSGVEWLADLARSWRAAGLGVVHHELAEFPSLGRLRGAIAAAPATSLGLSLSELGSLAGNGMPPAAAAAELARAAGAERTIVHADDWALAVFRDDPEHQRDVLMAGNLLAAARARAGRPAAALEPAPEALYTEDVPPTQHLGGGWLATAVPAPYLPRPAATVGLGDTFVAGVLLAESLR